jgi:hypothetical protein
LLSGGRQRGNGAKGKKGTQKGRVIFGAEKRATA